MNPKQISLLLLAACLCFCVGAHSALSQEKGSLELRMIAEQEVIVENEEGEKEIKREPVSKVIPGDHIIYTIVCKNIGDDDADSVVINNPVPEQTQYVPGTAGGEGAEITFSIDGGQNFDTPEKLIIVDQEGNERPATAVDYTNIRWVLRNSIPPGQDSRVYYRVELK